MTYSRKKIFRVVITAIFAALCFSAEALSVNGAIMIHIGNFICIMGAIIIGGVYGGIAGGIGMFIGDLVFGFGAPSAVATFILKFIMGFISGFLFRFFIKKNINVNKINIFFVVLFFVATILFTINYYYTGTSISDSLASSWLTPVLSFLMFIIFLVNFIFSNKLNRIQKSALVAASCAIGINIIGEIFVRAFFYFLLSGSYSTYGAAFSYAIADNFLSTLSTSIVTLVMIAFLFYPIYISVYNVNPLNDLKEYLDDEINKKDTMK